MIIAEFSRRERELLEYPDYIKVYRDGDLVLSILGRLKELRSTRYVALPKQDWVITVKVDDFLCLGEVYFTFYADAIIRG